MLFQGMMYDSNSSLNSVQSMQAQGFAQHQYGMHYNNSVWQQHQSNPGSGGFPQPQTNSRGQEFSHQNGSAAQAMMAAGNNSATPSAAASASAAQFEGSWQQQQQWQAANGQAGGGAQAPTGNWQGNPSQAQTSGQQSHQQAANNAKPSDPSYQRTFDYVQQCQSWTSQ